MYRVHGVRRQEGQDERTQPFPRPSFIIIEVFFKRNDLVAQDAERHRGIYIEVFEEGEFDDRDFFGFLYRRQGTRARYDQDGTRRATRIGGLKKLTALEELDEDVGVPLDPLALDGRYLRHGMVSVHAHLGQQG